MQASRQASKLRASQGAGAVTGPSVWRWAQCVAVCVGGRSALLCGSGPANLRLGVRRNGHRCRQVRRASLEPLSAPAVVRRRPRGSGDSRQSSSAERRGGSRQSSPLRFAGGRPL